MQPPSCLTVGTAFLHLNVSPWLLQTYFLTLWSSSSVFVLYYHKMFLQKAVVLSMWAAAYFRWVWSCHFWSRVCFSLPVASQFIVKKNCLHCGQWRWCSRSFQFTVGWSLIGSYASELPHQFLIRLRLLYLPHCWEFWYGCSLTNCIYPGKKPTSAVNHDPYTNFIALSKKYRKLSAPLINI